MQELGLTGDRKGLLIFLLVLLCVFVYVAGGSLIEKRRIPEKKKNSLKITSHYKQFYHFDLNICGLYLIKYGMG